MTTSSNNSVLESHLGSTIKITKYPDYTPIRGQEYALFSYYLTQNPQKNFHGVANFIGCFHTLDEIKSHVLDLYKQNPQLSPFFRYQYSGTWFVLDPRADPNNTDFLDESGSKYLFNKQLEDQNNRNAEHLRLLKQQEESEQVELALLDDDSLLSYSRMRILSDSLSRKAKSLESQLSSLKLSLNDYSSRISLLDSSYPDYQSRWESEGKPLLDSASSLPDFS